MATEIENITAIQAAFETIKRATRQEIKRGIANSNARHVNAWTHVLADITKVHADSTDRGFDLYPEFFDSVVIKDGDAEVAEKSLASDDLIVQPLGGGGR